MDGLIFDGALVYYLAKMVIFCNLNAQAWLDYNSNYYSEEVIIWLNFILNNREYELDFFEEMKRLMTLEKMFE